MILFIFLLLLLAMLLFTVVDNLVEGMRLLARSKQVKSFAMHRMYRDTAHSHLFVSFGTSVLIAVLLAVLRDKYYVFFG